MQEMHYLTLSSPSFTVHYGSAFRWGLCEQSQVHAPVWHPGHRLQLWGISSVETLQPGARVSPHSACSGLDWIAAKWKSHWKQQKEITVIKIVSTPATCWMEYFCNGLVYVCVCLLGCVTSLASQRFPWINKCEDVKLCMKVVLSLIHISEPTRPP